MRRRRFNSKKLRTYQKCSVHGVRIIGNVALLKTNTSNSRSDKKKICTHRNQGSILKSIRTFCLCCTLRSWSRKIFVHFRTVSPQLEDNYSSKYSSDNCPHTKYMSTCTENCQNYIAFVSLFSIRGRKDLKSRKTMGQTVPKFF